MELTILENKKGTARTDARAMTAIQKPRRELDGLSIDDVVCFKRKNVALIF